MTDGSLTPKNRQKLAADNLPSEWARFRSSSDLLVGRLEPVALESG